MKEYRAQVTIKAKDIIQASIVHADLEVVSQGMTEEMKRLTGAGEVEIGPIIEIETMQLVGIKDGREVDLGDVPLSPEMKAREFARQYGDPDNEDDVEANTALHCMKELVEWLRKQGQLK